MYVLFLCLHAAYTPKQQQQHEHTNYNSCNRNCNNTDRICAANKVKQASNNHPTDRPNNQPICQSAN